ncbi:MAG: retroviral-like aspartic protease family protein [Deltaproteobacteria bacterium]|nr:retroviral-like aspartic protease family protein [Deltaproteobacteria bacterium]
MPLVEFPYTLHKGYLLPIIPVSIDSHKIWVFVDSGATFSILSVPEAERIGVDWRSGRPQMIVVGDGSFIPTFIHNLTIQIGTSQVAAPVGFSERLGVGFNLLGRTGIFDRFQVCFNDRARRVTFQQLSSEAI